MSKHVHRDASTAWHALCATGGIELGGRDVDLEDRLKRELSSSAATLEDALSAATTDQLLRALFEVAQPFVQMFRDILEFFKAAGANEGRADWSIKIEDDHLDLRHFESFLEHWDEVECDLVVPAIDASGAFILSRLSSGIAELSNVFRKVGDPPFHTGISDVDRWLARYSRGEYLALPESLQPSRLGPGYFETANLLLVALGIIRQRWPNWQTMTSEHVARRYACEREDGLSFRTIAQNEADSWIGNVISRLAIAQRLPEERKAALGAQLAEAYAALPSRKIGARVTLTQLERILSLPIWQRRHELYSVWIATEIVVACSGHVIELNHEDGRIVFAFKETVVATLKSVSPVMRLVAEKRSPLENPVGHDRKANVQPDYGLWSGHSSSSHCKLIVEVKHYKRAAPARFLAVLQDYARAHPGAEILLVNYGPVGEPIVELPRDVFLRCKTIGDLTPQYVDRRKDFRKEVRKIVGEPGQLRGAVIALDISPSMAEYLRDPRLTTILREFAGTDGAVALVDSAVQKICSVHEVTSELSALRSSGTTSLVEPINALTDNYSSVSVLTDAEGYQDLSHRWNAPMRAEAVLPGLWLIQITGGPKVPT